MINLGTQYSTLAPKEIEITGNNVFIASNIQPYTKEIEDKVVSGFQYDYIQYTKDEYIIKLHNDIIDTQMALVELYEGEL